MSRMSRMGIIRIAWYMVHSEIISGMQKREVAASTTAAASGSQHQGYETRLRKRRERETWWECCVREEEMVTEVSTSLIAFVVDGGLV